MPTKRIHTLIVAALAIAGVAAAGATTPAPPLPGPALFDGRYYQFVRADKISWEAAKAAAENRTHNGIQGRLATIGSLQEDQFLDQLRKQTGLTLEFWVGGYQVKCVTGTPEPGCGWLWLNDEAIAATNSSDPYTNWQSGEPNNIKRTADTYSRATEDFLAIGHNGKFGWNDEGSLKNIRGYVIEYGDKVVVPATTCAEEGGCNPTGGQILQFPETATVAPDATLTARTFVIQDNPARCGVQPLTLFNGAVVIPPYLCGHPDFLVIQTQTTGVEILSGAIDVENLTEEVLPDNLYGCTGVRQNPVPGVVDPDPSHRDVVAWQTTDPLQMLETSLGTGRYFGTLTEVTYGCGSSRGKVREGSYHFVGLRIHPGAGNELVDGNPQGNHQSFIDLNRYKLELLRVSVVESKSALSPLSYLTLKTLVDAAVFLHEHEKYKLALIAVRTFVDAVERTKYKLIPGENFSGEHLMRGSNIEFMYAEKIVPFEP